MINKLKVFLADSSSLLSVIFVLTGSLLLLISFSDGELSSDDVGNVLTFLLAFSAFLSLQASNASINKKLQIEQQPLVVISLSESIENEPNPHPVPGMLSVKNIGRGPALGVRVSMTRFRDAKPIFDSSQPVTLDLAAQEVKDDWSLDEQVLLELIGDTSELNLYTTFADQLGNVYEMRTDLKLDGGFWRVVQNVKIG